MSANRPAPTPGCQMIMENSRKHLRAVPWGNGERVLCVVLGGIRMFVSSEDMSMAPHLALDGFFEPEVSALLWSLIKPGMRIIDVGAGYGYHTLLMAMLVGPSGYVDAIEAQPECAEILRDNFLLNGMQERVNIHCLIADTEARKRAMHLPLGPNHRIAGTTWEWLGPVEQRQLYTGRLDNMVTQPVALIHVDTRGNEDLVLAGADDLIATTAQFPTTPTIVLHWRPDRIRDVRKFAEWVASRGYTRVSTLTTSGTLVAEQDSDICNVQVPCVVVLERDPGGVR